MQLHCCSLPVQCKKAYNCFIQIFNENAKKKNDKQKLTSRSCKLCTLTQVFYRFIELIEILLFVIEHAILYFIIRAYINSCSTTYKPVTHICAKESEVFFLFFIFILKALLSFVFFLFVVHECTRVCTYMP